MTNLKGTKTEKNLQTAFAGESQARNKYTFYASQAKKKDLNRLPQSLPKRQTTKKNTQSCGLSCSMMASAAPQKT